MKELLFDRIESPVGDVLLVTDPERPELYALDYADFEVRMMKFLRRRFPDLQLTRANNPHNLSNLLEAYFNGDLRVIEKIAVNTGGTAFQQKVWQLLREIPTGTTASYGELAVKLGNRGASRAVGLANSLNPVAIVVPCHRVIGADKSLTGYAGGIERKRWLLEHERTSANKELSLNAVTQPQQLSLFNS